MTESLPTDGLCIGGAEHDWRTEWVARAPWHDRTEWRSQCRRCGLRRARIAFAPPDEDAEEGTVVIGGRLTRPGSGNPRSCPQVAEPLG